MPLNNGHERCNPPATALDWTCPTCKVRMVRIEGLWLPFVEDKETTDA